MPIIEVSVFKANHNIDFMKNLYPQSKDVDQYINQHQNVADLAPGKQKQKDGEKNVVSG